MRKLIHPGIRKALISFSAVFVTMTTIVVLSDVYRWDAEEKDMRANREMRQWRSKIDEANRSNQILVSHENSYKALKAKSVIGDEDRLSWVEVLHRVAEEHGLASIKYNIASQVMVDKKALGIRYSGMDIFRSVMSLDMKLMHEDDLVAVLGALKREAKGLFSVDKCDIQRLSVRREPGAGRVNPENLQAFCELSWYTFKKAVAAR